MLGKDADRNEYWFFKEEPGKFFVKKFELIDKPPSDLDEGNVDMIAEPVEPKADWYYYDEEEEFEKLLESCNVKGIRERKL